VLRLVLDDQIGECVRSCPPYDTGGRPGGFVSNTVFAVSSKCEIFVKKRRVLLSPIWMENVSMIFVHNDARTGASGRLPQSGSAGGSSLEAVFGVIA